MLRRSPPLHFEQRTYQMALGRDLERSTTVPERDPPAQRAACDPSDLGKTPHLRPPNGPRLSCGLTKPAATTNSGRSQTLARAQTLRFLEPRAARQLQALVRRHPGGGTAECHKCTVSMVTTARWPATRCGAIEKDARRSLYRRADPGA